MNAKPMQPLEIGAEVRIQHPLDRSWETAATIVGIGKFRDYLLKLPCGKSYWRNRRFIMQRMDAPPRCQGRV